jgi:hypothetical protein
VDSPSLTYLLPGLYSIMNMTQRGMTVRRFKALCDKPQYSMPTKARASDAAVEKAYWYFSVNES